MRRFNFPWSVTPGWRNALALLTIMLLTAALGHWLHGTTAEVGSDYSVLFLALLYVNLFLVLGLATLVVRNILRLWTEYRRNLAGSRLRTRMTLLLGALSLVPTLIIAVLSVELLNRGVDTWFSDQITQALQHSLDVARGYYRESQRTVRHDAEGLVRNRNVTAALTLQGPEAAEEVLEVERLARGLDEVAIIRADGTRIAVAGELPFDPLPDLTTLAEGSTKALLFANDTGDRVRAFVRLDNDIYLSTGRWIDRQIFSQMETMEKAYVDYKQIRQAHGLLKTSHTVTMALITVLLLLAAIYFGIRIADNLITPISQLVIGTRQVASGDLTVTMRVAGSDELAILMEAFNAMTRKLNENRQELRATNALLEERRRFMEAIVGNISAGVISVNRGNKVTLINSAAAQLLGVELSAALNRSFAEVMPRPALGPLQELWQKARAVAAGRGGQVESLAKAANLATQIVVEGPDKPLTLLARMTLLWDDQGQEQGFIATFDDLTEVLNAQRAHAWSDVARRIAHEIKNPLTPIQLSAQRVRRKYLRGEGPVEGSPKVLDECTNTIINQVEELRVLVNEFSTFARLPRPNLQEADLHEAVREVLVLHKGELRGVRVDTDFDAHLPAFPFDRGQLKQVLINLVANAIAAMEEQTAPAGGGRLAITTRVAENGRFVQLSVADSGPGIPPADRDRVFEPYFTTKKKGTGLGMAIVKKIIEDHGGSIRLSDAPQGGLLVECRLPLSGPLKRRQPENTVS